MDTTDCGVSGLGGPGATRNECVDAREEGREIGRLVGVRKRNGTPAVSSLLACISSST